MSSTLIYHPVNSPLLVPADAVEDDIATSFSDNLDVFNTPEVLEEDKTASRHNDTVVPPFVHFVFGLDESFGGKPFAFAHYLSMYSGRYKVTSKPHITY